MYPHLSNNLSEVAALYTQAGVILNKASRSSESAPAMFLTDGVAPLPSPVTPESNQSR